MGREEARGAPRTQASGSGQLPERAGYGVDLVCIVAVPYTSSRTKVHSHDPLSLVFSPVRWGRVERCPCPVGSWAVRWDECKVLT